MERLIKSKLNFFNTKNGVEIFNLNGSATAIDVFSPEGEKIVTLVQSQGNTPSTYYSGNRVITNTAVITADGFKVVATAEVSGRSNDDAFFQASQKILIFADSFGGSCKGFNVFRKIERQNAFGSVAGSEKINWVSMGEPRRATPEEFGRACTSLDVHTNAPQTSVMYAGWKKPQNLIEEGTHNVGILNEIFEEDKKVNVFIPFAYKSTMDEYEVINMARQDVESYFSKIYGYEKEKIFSVDIKYRKNFFINEEIPDNMDNIPCYKAELLINSAKIKDIQEYLDSFDGEFCEESPKIKEVGFRWMSEKDFTSIQKEDGTYMGATERNRRIIN